MRPYLIVVANPSLHQHLCFKHRVKEFAIQESDPSTITGSGFYKIITPYMVLMLSSQTNAATIRQPESAFFYLLFRKLQTFFPPDSFNTLMVDQNPFIPKHISNHPIPDSSVISNQSDDRGSDLIFVAAFHRFSKTDRNTTAPNILRRHYCLGFERFLSAVFRSARFLKF